MLNLFVLIMNAFNKHIQINTRGASSSLLVCDVALVHMRIETRSQFEGNFMLCLVLGIH